MSTIKNDTYQLKLPGGVNMEFVYVPSGEFTMGGALHRVYLDEYWIGKYPVTNEQYRTYVEHQEFNEPQYADRYYNPTKQQHPVVGVSWFDSKGFCDWLSQFSGEKIRLPTDAQWEKAARGTDGRNYPWGKMDPTPKLANFNHIIGDTTPVGSYPEGASPYGALDMAGNVWERVADWFDENYYRNLPSKNPAGPDTGNCRVRRGGSWTDPFDMQRVTTRACDLYVPVSPGYSYYNLGFRCLRSAAL